MVQPGPGGRPGPPPPNRRRQPGLHGGGLRPALHAGPGREGGARPGHRLPFQPRRQDRHDHAAPGRDVQRRHAVQRAGRAVELEPRPGAGGREGRHRAAVAGCQDGPGEPHVAACQGRDRGDRAVHPGHPPGRAGRRVHQPAVRLDRHVDRLAHSRAEGSPTAVQKEGPRTFARYPVGAGPFTVVSDSYNSELVVRKNPRYWEAGHPYLDQITFKSAGSDEAAIEALLAGQGQVYENMSTTTLINQAQQHLQVENNLGTSPYDLQLNTAVPPFNNPKARQAIYAATGFAPILKAVFGTRYPLTEGFTGPGGICHESAVPGYQGYDPALARKLAAESGLGKVTFTLGTINSSAAAVETTKALRAEWAQVGIHAAIRPYNLLSLVPAFAEDHGRPWQAMVQTAGAFDPASGAGAGLRFDSASPFSGVHDPHLDWLLSRARSYTSLATRCKYYREAAAYIAENYYGPFCFSLNPANVSAKGTGGPGLTSTLPAVVVAPAIPWEDVRYSPPE